MAGTLVPYKVNTLIVKHNDLVNFHGYFSPVESKIMCLLISRLDRMSPDKITYNMSTRDIIDLLGTAHKDEIARIHSLAKGLVKKSMSIPTEDGFLVTTWLCAVKYEAKQGEINFTFSPEIIPYLFCLKEHFTMYRLKNILPLRSSYSLRIYELLKQYQSLGERVIELEDLKRILCVEDKYKKYSHFKQRVILSAQRELEKKTDISFDFFELKKGKSVQSIRFVIKKSTKNILEEDIVEEDVSGQKELTLKVDDLIQDVFSDSPPPPHIDECWEVENLAKFASDKFDCNIKEDTLKTILERTGTSFERLRDHIKRMNGTYSNPVGFLLQSLQKNYSLPDVK